MPGGEARRAGGVCKRSAEPERTARLAHEARVLALLKGWPLPGLLAFRRRAHRALLVTQALPGRHPTADELRPGAAPRRALEAALAALHGQGWVHGDLARANVIWDGTRAWLLDLEHAAPIGAEIATLPARAVRPGLTHPDVIWGRGRMGPWVDHWALARLAAGAGRA